MSRPSHADQVDRASLALAGIDVGELRDVAVREECRRSLHAFVRRFWHVLEPGRAFVDNWHIRAFCDHLEAVTTGEITRLLINCPPGAMKSLLLVFWNAWEWGPRGLTSTRYLTFSYSEDLTIRDNRRCRMLIASAEYQRLWGGSVAINPKLDSAQRFDTTGTGWRIASSVGGMGTGERADRLIVDDPHSVQHASSDLLRTAALDWWREVVPTRVNDPVRSAFVVIMQRVHQDDVSNEILDHFEGWVHLMIPMRFDPHRRCETEIGWADPRTEEGELYWPDRFPESAVARDERVMGPYAVAGQFQQEPSPKGGGLIKSEWWQYWAAEDFPAFSTVIASLDTAASEKELAAYSALTTWGLWPAGGGINKVMLKHAWRDRVGLHALVMAVGKLCQEHKVDILLIEDKGGGIQVHSEIVRLFGLRQWRTFLITPKGDKVGRLLSVEPLFAEGMIYAPDRAWAQMVIDEVTNFPNSKYKDLTDTVSQALRYIRTSGGLVTKEEAAFEAAEALRYKGPARALYEV